MESHFDWYGAVADKSVDYTELSGRYSSQRQDEKGIFADVSKKLDLKPVDSVLEIGCGVGQILIPASFMVSQATGVDHPKILSALRRRFPVDEIELIPGNFLDLKFDEDCQFNKVLVYSVLQTLPDWKTIELFLSRALRLVAPGGKILIGDIPNTSKKQRFLSTEQGLAFHKEWRKKTPESKLTGIEKPPTAAEIDDSRIQEILQILEDNGFEADRMNQPKTLPFSNSREDILGRRIS